MARKRLALLAAICLAIALLLPQYTMAAADSPAFSVVTSQSAMSKGEDVTVTIKGSNLQDVYAYELHLYYDSELLTFKKGSETTSAVGFGTPAEVVDDGNGEAHIVFAHTKTGQAAGDAGSLDLAAFTFTSIADGSADIGLRHIQLVDSKLASTAIDDHVDAQLQIGSTGSGSGPIVFPGNSGTTGSPEGVVSVTPEQLKDDGTGKAIVELPEKATSLKLPADTDELLGKASLRVVAGKAALDIPAAAFAQLKAQLTDAQLQGGSISLSVNAVPIDDSSALGADMKPGGSAYELKLQWIAADGTAYDLHEFNEPLTLHLAVDPSVNAKLASIFYLPDNGAPEFIGGIYRDGEYVATITHFSSYAVLVVDKTFSDVPDSYWASAVIKELYAKQIVTGTSDTAFEPGRSVTRAEFTALLVRALGLKAEGTPVFADIPAGAWYAGDVAAAYKAGIVQGMSDTLFAPGAGITRQEMVTIAMRGYELLKGKPAGTSAVPFKDEASIAAWALDYVEEAASLGLVQGRAAGEFVPLGSSTRAEAAQMIYGVLNGETP